jgi:hypothetical protein
VTPSESQSVLSNMAASLMQDKQTASAKLTPVPSSLPTTSAPFPNDVPAEVVQAAVKNIRREVQYILTALDAIDEAVGAPDPVALINMDELAKEKERAADEKFAERFERLKAEAQAATFQAPADDLAWVCPEHGSAKPRKSAKGRDYIGCGNDECKAFKR